MAASYTYKALHAGEIRILHLLPQIDGDTLQCKLENCSLRDSKNHFVALSWTWGDKPKPEVCLKINLNGEQFRVWPSLHKALRALRKDDETLRLWVDAICINQEDITEMNSQIPLMAEIYTSASEVFVWLGEPENDSDYVMETLRSNRKEDLDSDRFVLGLFEMLLRPWWTRTWILQEYVLNATPPKVFCGKGTSVSAELLLNTWREVMLPRKAIAGLFHRGEDLRKLGSRYWLYSLRESRYNPNGETLTRNLRNALYWLKSFQVTEPRDKVYGVLGLIESKWRDLYVKDPTVNTERSSADVFHDATIYLLKYEKSSTFFYDFPIGRQSNSDSPSWVPNFNPDMTAHAISPVRLGDVTSKHLDDSRDDVTFSEDNLTLITHGLIVDHIKERIVVEDRPFMTLDANDLFSNIFKLLKLFHQIQALVDKGVSYKRCEIPSEPLWKTLIAGCYGAIQDDELKDEPACQARFEEWMAIPLDAFQNHIMTIMYKMSQKPNIINKIGQTLSPRRCFFAGEQGSYGISEAGAQEGDVIALLFPKHFVPFVLRKIDNHFEMVGTAYIPGPLKEAVIQAFMDDRHILQELVIQ